MSRRRLDWHHWAIDLLAVAIILGMIGFVMFYKGIPYAASHPIRALPAHPDRCVYQLRPLTPEEYHAMLNLHNVTHILWRGHRLSVLLIGAKSLTVALPAGLPPPPGSVASPMRHASGLLWAVPARGNVLIRRPAEKSFAPS